MQNGISKDKPSREGRPAVINKALRNLGCEVESFEDFVSELKGTIKPKGEGLSSITKSPTIFNEIYQNLPDILTQLKERIQKCHQELREMLI